jgi:hypothetical protein
MEGQEGGRWEPENIIRLHGKVVETRFPRNGTHKPGQQLIFVHSGRLAIMYASISLYC